jgi:hypothetical protein
VHADYNGIVYTKIPLEARDVWTSDPLWRPFYHESSNYWISATGFARQVLKNFEELGVKAELYSYPVDQARKQYAWLFGDADYMGIREILGNKTSGWADAKDVLQKVIEAAVRLGVEYVEAGVVALEFEHGGEGGCIQCIGVGPRPARPSPGIGSFSARGYSRRSYWKTAAPKRTDLHVGGRVVAAAVTEAPLDDEKVQSFGGMPVVIQEVPPERGEATSQFIPFDTLGLTDR